MRVRARERKYPLSSHPWYKLKIWCGNLRPVKLSEQPLCEWCLANNIIRAAEVVHHRIAHKGDWSLFTDYDNLEALCKRCHDSEAQSIERRGYNNRIGDDGWPVDPDHPSNKRTTDHG